MRLHRLLDQRRDTHCLGGGPRQVRFRLVHQGMAQADGGRDEDAILRRLEHVERFLVAVLGVVDHVDPGDQAVPDRLDRARVGIDLLAEAVRRCHRHPDLLQRHRRGMRGYLGIERVAGHIELDVVAALAAAQTHGLAHFLGAVDDDRRTVARIVQLALVPEPPGHRDLEGSGTHTRPLQTPGVDFIAHRDIEAQLRGGCAVGAGETVVEQGLRDARRQQRVFLGRRGDQVLGASDAIEGQMRMTLRHAGHQEPAGAVDLQVGARAGRRTAGRDGADAVALDQQIADKGAGTGPVPDAGVANQCRLHVDRILSCVPRGFNAESASMPS